MKISVNIPSYKRPYVKTLEYLPEARVFVAESEYEDYKKNNSLANIVKVPDEVQGNLSRIRNWIYEYCFNEGDDAVCILDDDCSGIYLWEGEKSEWKYRKMSADEFYAFLEKYTIMAKDIGIYFWGIGINEDTRNYRMAMPFNFTRYVGGPFGVMLRGCECRYDENLPLKEDYDLTLQILNRYRRILRVNKAFYIVKQSEQRGGCAEMRNFVEEERQLNLLIKKWGSDVVRLDKTNKSERKIKKLDYNPIIRAKIKGV